MAEDFAAGVAQGTFERAVPAPEAFDTGRGGVEIRGESEPVSATGREEVAKVETSRDAPSSLSFPPIVSDVPAIETGPPFAVCAASIGAWTSTSRRSWRSETHPDSDRNSRGADTAADNPGTNVETGLTDSIRSTAGWNERRRRRGAAHGVFLTQMRR
jgi:hypothetical protein